MSSNLGFAILGRFKFKRFHSWWYDLSSTCNQRLLSEFYLQNALSSDIWFCLRAIFPDSPFKGWYIYILPGVLSQRKCKGWSPIQLVSNAILSYLEHMARDIWPRKFQKIYIFNPSRSFSWSGSIGNCKTAKLFLFAVLLQFNPSQICFIKI